MILYDISSEILSSPVFPGDPKTQLDPIRRISDGDSYNLSAISMSLHTGTHIDSPLHFVEGGISVNEMDLSDFMGECDVVSCLAMDDEMTGEDIESLLKPGCRKVLFKTNGRVRLTRSAAFALISAGVGLVGIDAPSISTPDEDECVHKELGLAGIAILEGLTLRHVQSGKYTLMALPIKLSSAEAAPCRAILMK